MIPFERKILIGAVGFMVFIVALVIGCMKQDFFLVSKDYYRQEINYQQHIDKVNKTAANKRDVNLENKATAGYVTLHFPNPEKENNRVEGKITFFRPSDARKDVVIPIDLNESHQQAINIKPLDKGLWKIKVDWTEAGEAYYNDFTLIMP